MGEMQTKILTAIRKHAEKAGLEVVDQPQYSNTGSVFLMDGFTTKLSFGYDFQAGYATLQFYPEGKKISRTCGFTDPDCVLNAYLKYEDLSGKMQEIYKLIDTLGGVLKRGTR